MNKHYLAMVFLALIGCTSQPVINDPGAHQFDALTEHTVKLGPLAEPEVTTIDALHWMVGSWRGEAFGSHIEETWNPPSAGSMVGLFKVFDGDDVSFYELLTIAMGAAGLEMRVRHFNADFSAWEDKDDFIRFPLLFASETVIHFAGLSFYRRGNNEIEGYIAMRNKEGELYEERLSYERYTY